LGFSHHSGTAALHHPWSHTAFHHPVTHTLGACGVCNQDANGGAYYGQERGPYLHLSSPQAVVAGSRIIHTVGDRNVQFYVRAWTKRFGGARVCENLRRRIGFVYNRLVEKRIG
jgi:hypothetical protein